MIGRVDAQRGSGKITVRLARYVTQHDGGIYGNFKLGLLWDYDRVKPASTVAVSWPRLRTEKYKILPHRDLILEKRCIHGVGMILRILN